MGGCRCSYRSCKARSDGQTHMFHFPVFDKMRCHQWITNSLKPDFLNLKLSQLKNRVVCQHHFKEDNFMNFKRDKLKSNAVPTENGPFCVSDHSQTMIMEENDKPVIPINADDIENEILNSVEKKAHSSVKYGDFLISDVTELFNSSHNSIDNETSQKVLSRRLNRVKNTTGLLNEKNGFGTKYKSQNDEDNLKYTINYSNDDQSKSYLSNLNQNPTVVSIEFEEPSNPNKLLNTLNQPQKSETFNSSEYQSHSVKKTNPDKVIKMLSEKIISEPLLVGGKFEPISPSMMIRRSAKKLESYQSFEQNENMKPQLKEESCKTNNSVIIPQDQTIVFEQTIPIEYAPKESEIMYKADQSAQENIYLEKQSEMVNLNNNENQYNLNDGQNNVLPIEHVFNYSIQIADKVIEPEHLIQNQPESNSTEKQPKLFLTPTSSPTSKSLLKSKITPEKLAAIKEKRKFNLKLRDVITSCLDNLEDQNEVINKKIPQKAVNRILRSQVSNPPSSQSNMIAYLEARLQRMEDTLLNKIDHNTQRINELKRTVKPSSNTRHANTQTYFNHMTEQSQKQYLYKEISKFLSPNANIKIYEELFANKTQDDLESSSPRKLRRRR